MRRHRLVDQAETLYRRYGKPLEPKHTGSFVAISADGAVVLGHDLAKLEEKAFAKFGSGKFVVTRIGKRGVGRWLEAAQSAVSSTLSFGSGSR